MTRAAIAIVAAVSVFRILVGAHLPLTEDESYYWSWSRHLAYGYTDHPPMVAWLIALCSPLGKSPLAVRLPFIACEAAAALALGAAATTLSGSARAGTVATAMLSLLPQTRFAVGEALPDGPYLMFWSLALLFAARIARGATWPNVLLLGISLGGALLSRFFGWAIVAGIAVFMALEQRRALLRSRVLVAFLVALVLYAPFLLWNAQHGWENFAFTFRGRQTLEGFSATHLAVLSTIRYLAYAGAFWIVAVPTIIHARRNLLAWTALPFPTALIVLAFFVPVDSYWLLGPFLSLCAAIAIAYAGQGIVVRRSLAAVWIAAGVVTFVSVALLSFSSPVYAYAPLSRAVKLMINVRGVIPMSDRFEIASELNYHGVGPLMIGAAPQVPQWQRWNDPRWTVPPRGLLVTFAPLDAQRDTSARLRRAYGEIVPGPVFRYHFGNRTQTFYTTWATQPRDGASEALFRR